VAAPVVVILAAGQGTRMRSAVPKMLHSVCGRALVAWPIAAARAAGAEQIVLVDSPDRHLEPFDGPGITVAVQEEPRGTADAVRAGMSAVDSSGTVLVLNGDVPLIGPETLAALVASHERNGAAATIATMALDDPTGYGRVVRAPDGSVERVVETKSPGDATELELHIREINTGMFAFDAEALRVALAEVKSDNAQGELYLPDVLPIMREHERTVQPFELDDPTEILQINDRVQLGEVTAVAQAQIHARHQQAGVTVVNPGATLIDADVEIGPDTTIAPFTSLRGRTTIGSGSTIGPNSTLLDGRVGNGSTVIHSYVVEAQIGDRVSVGPFAYLRPGTVLHEGSKAGTFVEIKNSQVGAGSKVPHLSYIGDADIGEQTNLGASTITANYDGYRKHHTTIGDRVKTSVDTTLVAPVSIGDDAHTGAGSVINEDVPPGALGIARARQRNVEDYNERRRRREEDQSQAQSPGETGLRP
jgi:bifunctional UDP-N-acetylglucosamine pyrophosphorylase/glucosamine-1-phosphate N-acetyltransferase